MGDNVGYGWMNGWLAACCLHHTVSWGQPINFCFLGLSDIQVKFVSGKSNQARKESRDNVRMLFVVVVDVLIGSVAGGEFESQKNSYVTIIDYECLFECPALPTSCN